MILLILTFIIFLYLDKRTVKRSVLETFKKEEIVEKNNKKPSRKNKVDYVVKVAIFATISSLLYTVPFLQFKLPFCPQFLEFQFSNLPGILAGFILGPLGGSLVILIKTIVKLPMSGTMFVGECADLIIGVSVVCVSSLIYRKHRTLKGGALALLAGAIVWVGASLFANWAVLIRWYAHLFGGMKTIINMCTPVVPFINQDNFMLVYLSCCCLPFNSMLALITMIVTFITYKSISKIFKKEFFKK